MQAKAAFGIIVFAVVGCAVRPAALASDALGLEEMPASVRDVRCKRWGATDALTTCSLKLETQDFTQLLAGRQWTRNAAAGGSYGYGSGPRVGAEFPVAAVYEAVPNNAPNGGVVRLVADATRTQAQVDLYVE